MDEQTSPQPPNENTSSGSDDTNIRELALALVAARYPDAADDKEPQLLPGQLPPTFPSDFRSHLAVVSSGHWSRPALPSYSIPINRLRR